MCYGCPLPELQLPEREADPHHDLLHRSRMNTAIQLLAPTRILDVNENTLIVYLTTL